MKIVASLFLVIASLSLSARAQTPAKTDSTSYVKLFDFSERWYGPDANETRIKWEEEFIAFGKRTENTPERYIRHIMNWFYLDGTHHSLSELRLNYIFGSGQYSIDYYRTSTDTDEYTRESLREGYLFTHISRSSENVTRLWGIFGGLVKEIAGAYLKKGRPERQYIQGLVDAWSCITSQKGYKKKLDSCYKKLVTEKPDTYSMINYVEDFKCDVIQNTFGRDDEANYITNSQWLYTFWVRRHHEGNVEATLAALNFLLE